MDKVLLCKKMWDENKISVPTIAKRLEVNIGFIRYHARKENWPERTYKSKNHPKSSEWTQEKIDIAYAEWMAGTKKVPEIAKLINVSLYALSVKSRKLKWPPKKAAPRQSKGRKQKPLAEKFVDVHRLKSIMQKDELMDLMPDIGHTSLLKIKEHQCRCPTGGKDEDGSHKYCGLPIFKRDYCKKHYDRFYVQPPQKQASSIFLFRPVR